MFQDMKNVHPSSKPWEKLEGDILPVYQKIKCHFIFDVKTVENFHCKSCFVSGRHMKETPATLIYTSIVSRDLVRIALNIAALNGLDILSCDIHNAYLTDDF